MPIAIYFSDFFDVSPDEIESYGAFNVSLVNDLPLFVDPFLLFNSEKEEYQALHRQIIDYLRFLRDVSAQPGISPGLLQSWFQFPEVKQNWLGYSLIGNQGSGLGRDFAQSLNRNLYTVFANFGREDVVRSSHLEKLCLIREGVGKDNISDFTTNLIKAYLLNYTQAFATKYIAPELRKRVAIEKVHFNYETQTWVRGIFDLPYYNGDYVILTPKDILTKDDIWINRADIVGQFEDIVDSIPNDELRAQINNYFLQALPLEHTKRDIASAVSSVISQYPAILDYYVRFKEDHGEEAKRVSEEKVDETETFFVTQVRQFVEEYLIPGRFYESTGNTYTEAYARALFLKDVIENKDGYRIFYINGQPLKRESDLQILYRLTWFATVSDVNREVNNGRGLVDYKISRGRKDSTLIEFKLASNGQLRRNLEKQIAIYEKASDTEEILVWKLGQQIGRQREMRLANTEDIIRQITGVALTITHPDPEYELELKSGVLCSMRGVGMPVASAVLALMFPERYAVIDFRGWRQVFGKDATAFYVHDYKKYMREIWRLAAELGWPPQEVDFAIWEYDRRANR